MAFIAGPTTPPAEPEAEDVIENDGFFPNVDPAAIRKQYRIRDGVTVARLREAIIAAIFTVGNDLDAWGAAHQAAGAATLAAVDQPQIGGDGKYVLLYRRAIGSETRANLIDGYRDTDLTGAGDRKLDDLEPSAADMRRDRLYAVRDILGVGRSTIELL